MTPEEASFSTLAVIVAGCVLFFAFILALSKYQPGDRP